MAVDYATFVAEFSEYDQLDQTLVETKIADAQLLQSETAWGDLYDLAVKYTAADLLAKTPEGFQMALRTTKGGTIYEATYKMWVRARNSRRGAVL